MTTRQEEKQNEHTERQNRHQRIFRKMGTKTSVLFALANIEGQFLYLRSQYRLGLTDSVQREKIAEKHCQSLITEFNDLLFLPEGLTESMAWDIVRVAKELPWTPWNWDPLCPF